MPVAPPLTLWVNRLMQAFGLNNMNSGFEVLHSAISYSGRLVINDNPFESYALAAILCVVGMGLLVVIIQAGALRQFSMFSATKAIVIAVCVFLVGFIGAKQVFITLSVIGAQLIGVALRSAEGVLIGTILAKKPWFLLLLIAGLAGSSFLMAFLERGNPQATAVGFFVWQGILAATAASKAAIVTHELVENQVVATLSYGTTFVGVAVFLPPDTFSSTLSVKICLPGYRLPGVDRQTGSAAGCNSFHPANPGGVPAS